MKILLTICCIFTLLITSCQKEIFKSEFNDDFVTKLYQSLRDSLRPNTFNRLDWRRIARARPGMGIVRVVRVPFLNESYSRKFLIVKANALGDVQSGLLVESDLTAFSADGTIRISFLNGFTKAQWNLKDGYRINDKLNKETAQPSPEHIPPPLIVNGTFLSQGSLNVNIYYSYISLFTNEPLGATTGTGGGNFSGWYGSGNPYGGGVATGSPAPGIQSGPGSGTAGGQNGFGIPYTMFEEDLMLLEFETGYSDPAIKVENFLKCFANIPDAGSTCKIAIYTDLPVDGDPTRIFNFISGSSGHVFIRLEKKNGAAFAKQYFGLYPKSALQASATTAPIDAKIVNNSDHEYNAYAELFISPAQLQVAIDKLKAIAVKPQYMVDRYNCADFGLNIWNATVSPNFTLDIPKYHIPGSMTTQSSTPQGLYVKLQEMKNANHPLAAGMQVNVNQQSGNGTGECN